MSKAEFFTYTADANGYMLFYKGKPMGGAAVMRRDPSQRRHWRHSRANVKMFNEQAQNEIAHLKNGEGQARFREVMAKIDAEQPKTAKLLPSQKDTPAMAELVLDAARAILTQHADNLIETFEHGHWWVTCRECGGQWDAVDAEGGQSVDGFDFEKVTAPDEDAHREEG